MGNACKKVLFVCAVWPEPKSSAGGTRMMQLLRFFKSLSYEVYCCSAASHTPYMEDLDSEGIVSFSVKLNCESFDADLIKLQPSVVVFDRFMMEEQYGWRVDACLPDALKIIETIDLHCLRLARKELSKSSGDLKETLLNSKLAQRELAAMYRSDLSIMISKAEMHILEDCFSFPKKLLFYLPFDVYSEYLKLKEFKQLSLSYGQRTDFVSIGNFKHEPNWDSVLHLKTVIFPLIKQQLPKAQIKIYGSYPDKKALNLHNEKEGFYVLGRAKDALDVTRKARVSLAPLRFGAGIKGKLIDAMLAGTPSVTTVIGAEGMKGKHEWPGVVASDDQDFADAAVKLFVDQDYWERKAACGDEILKHEFDASIVSAELAKVIAEGITNLRANRSVNFIGSMLRHHGSQSTKYMSKWIEEKNKAKNLKSSIHLK